MADLDLDAIRERAEHCRRAYPAGGVILWDDVLALLDALAESKRQRDEAIADRDVVIDALEDANETEAALIRERDDLRAAVALENGARVQAESERDALKRADERAKG